MAFRTVRPFSDSLCLVGDRVSLRPLMESDAEAVFDYARDAEVTHFMPWEPAPDAESVRPFLAEQVEKRRKGTALALAVTLNENGQLIGSTDLMDLHIPETGTAELGYLLARPYWGRGLMTEAAELTVRHGFGALGLAKVVAWADAENIASRRVLEKLGMRILGSEIRAVKEVKRLYIRYEIGQVQR